MPVRRNRDLVVAGGLAFAVFLFFSTSWFAGLVIVALLSLAVAAAIPGVGTRVLRRIGWVQLPLVGRLTGLAASATLVATAFVTSGLAVALAPVPSASPNSARAPASPTTSRSSTRPTNAPTNAPTFTAANPTVSTGAPLAAALALTPPSVTPTPATIPTTAPTVATPATPTLLPTPVPTVTPTPMPSTARPATAAPSANLVITRVFYDGVVPRTESDEFVEIQNTGGVAQSMSGWRRVSARAGQTFFFPAITISAGQTCRVYTNEIHAEWCSLSFRSGSAIWNNAGDRANLTDAQGRLVSSVGYNGY